MRLPIMPLRRRHTSTQILKPAPATNLMATPYNPPYQDPPLPQQQPTQEDLAAFTEPVAEMDMSQLPTPVAATRPAKGLSFDWSVLNAQTQEEYDAKPPAIQHLIHEIKNMKGLQPTQEWAANRVIEIQKEIAARNSPKAKAEQAATAREALGKPLTSSEVNDMTALKGVSTSLDVLEKKLSAVDDVYRGPIAGRFVSSNPYDKEAQEIDNIITSIVPGLARGVFGEVGVLTDSDTKRYTKLLPNLNSPPEIAKANLANLREKLESATIEKIETMQKAGMNVSGFMGDYEKLVQARASRQQNAPAAVNPQVNPSQNQPAAPAAERIIRGQRWILNPQTGKYYVAPGQ